MNRLLAFILAGTLTCAVITFAAESSKSGSLRPEPTRKMLSPDLPRLFFDEDFASGAQPAGDASAKAAASGFRSAVRGRAATEGIEAAGHIEAPIILCIDDKPVKGGQPSGAAYAKAAASGYRSVLTLRAKEDGVDLAREKWLVERNKMRYFNLPAAAGLPRFEQVDQFLALVRDKTNHPMLINCAFAERVAPFMMVFHLTEQGWSEERALKEAKSSGVDLNRLKKFARDYLVRLKPKQP